MAININVKETDKITYLDKIVYQRLSSQTPMDFAVTYLSSLENLFSFYEQFNMDSYDDFYVNDKYRVKSIKNEMRKNGYEAASKSDPTLYHYTYYNGVDEYTDFSNDIIYSFNSTDTFSFSAWTYFNTSDYQMILSKQETSSGDFQGYSIRKFTNNKVFFQLVFNSQDQIQVEIVTPINIQEWYNIVVTYDGSSGAAGVNIYINGVQQALNILFNTLAFKSTINTTPLILGGRDDLVTPFNGFMDDFSIFNTELNQTDITTIYNYGRKDPILNSITGLISHFKMDNVNPINQVIGNISGTGFNIDNTNIKTYQ